MTLVVASPEGGETLPPFVFVPDRTALALSQVMGEIRIEQNPTDETVSERHILGFAEAQAAYESALARLEAATWNLFDVMGVTNEAETLDESQWSVNLHSWHESRQEIPGSKPGETLQIPVATRVAVAVTKHLRPSQRLPALISLRVTHYPLHRAIDGTWGLHFRGTRAGGVVFDKGGVGATPPEGERLEEFSFAKAKQSVIEALTREGRREGVTPLAQAIVEQAAHDPVEGQIITEESHPTSQQRFLCEVLNGNPDDSKSLIMLLESLFKPDSMHIFNSLLERPVSQLLSILSGEVEENKQAAARRMFLVLGRLTVTRQLVKEHVNHAVVFGFADAFRAQLARVEQRIAFLNSLATTLASSTARMPKGDHPGDEPTILRFKAE